MRGCNWLKIPKFSQRSSLTLRWDLGEFWSIATAHLFCEISVQHVSWCKLENIVVEQSFVAVYGESRR
jgi:hypothetical protein